MPGNPTDNFHSTFDGLMALVAHLRGPEGCPWDREQTSASIKAGFLEECYELLEAIERGDPDRVLEELGDVLLHVAMQVRIAQETSKFSERQVFERQIEKLIRRHPHVFGDADASDAREVEAQWERIKERERKESGGSLLDGVPVAMPALGHAHAIQRRAARVGFDWPDVDGVLDKVVEELGELRDASGPERREEELGDLLFSLVNASRWLGLEPEAALRGANARFRRRFALMGSLCRERGQTFADLTLEAKESLWQEAKRATG